jgi:pimeloyl-ACP methyl ester carboxylesterase
VRIIAASRKLVAMTLITLSGLGVVAASPAAPAAGAAGRVPKGDAFYVPPKPLAKAKPGTIIRSARIADAPAGARAWKILYHSRAVDGSDIAVSGVVIAPTGKAPRGGRVVVTWAHGTSGLADLCAPSKQPDIASGAASTSGPAGYGAWMPMVQTFLDAGYVVAATDYEGIGTPGLHPFLVGESEGRSVLDAARAAHGLKAAAAARKVIVFGHSQGGHAALFAGELAAAYAPELRVLGVAAGAPAPDVEHTLPLVQASTPANGFVVAVVEGFHAAYPKFDPATILTPDALAQASIVDQKCFADVAQALSGLPDPVLAHNPLDIPALKAIVVTNSFGNRPAGAPLLVVQGTADTFVPQFATDAFVKKACAAGDTVDYLLIAGANHGGELPAAANDVAAWFADRVSGAPAANTCK